MKQSARASLIEAAISTAAGFGLSMLLQAICLPRMGVPISMDVNFYFACIMTVASLLRQFVLRRLFERMQLRVKISRAMTAIILERQRQIDVERFDHAHDDAHDKGDLALAGAAYAVAAVHPDVNPPAWFPFERGWWKPDGFRHDLIRSGALILAELERFDRKQKKSK